MSLGSKASVWLPVILTAAVVLAYWNSLQAPFLFDDTGAILTNPTIRRLDSFDVLKPPSDGSTTTGRPLINLSFALNYALGGERSWGYHVTNVAFHVCAALVLMGVIRRTLLAVRGPVVFDVARVPSIGGTSADPLRYEAVLPASAFGIDAAMLVGFLAALLWAVHPLQTETVVCIAQRTELLCGLFYLVVVYAFARGASPAGGSLQSATSGAVAMRRSRYWLGLSWFACLLGMATKEVMVTAPVIVWLYDRTFVAGSFVAAWRLRKRYYLALMSTWILLGGLLLAGRGSRGVAGGFGLGVSWWDYLLTQADALVRYLQLSFWPHPLVLDYGRAVAGSLGEVFWQGSIVLALIGGSIWAFARRPALGFAAAAFFVVLAPSSSIVPLVTQTVAEHRMYLPLALLVAAVSVAAARWWGGRAVMALVLVAAGFGSLTVARNRDYRAPAVIWADTVAKAPANARAHNNLAWSLQQSGRVMAASEHYARAIALDQSYVSARYNWGVALLAQGRIDEAIAQLETVLRLAPDHPDARLYLGNALVQAQRPTEAVTHYEVLLRTNPAADVHYNLALALVSLGRLAEAESHFRAALQGDDRMPEAWYRLAVAAEDRGTRSEAERLYAATLRLDPNHIGAHRRLGLLFAQSQRLDAAAEHFQAVLRLQPDDADAHANLGNVHLLRDQPGDAITQYEIALRLRPGDARTRENLEIARQMGRQ